jgi:hypothetical protein
MSPFQFRAVRFSKAPLAPGRHDTTKGENTMFDLLVYSSAVAVLAVLILGALGLALVALWLVAAVVAWERTRPEVRD